MKINSAMEEVRNWLNVNDLQMNTSKTQEGQINSNSLIGVVAFIIEAFQNEKVTELTEL